MANPAQPFFYRENAPSFLFKAQQSTAYRIAKVSAVVTLVAVATLAVIASSLAFASHMGAPLGSGIDGLVSHMRPDQIYLAFSSSLALGLITMKAVHAARQSLRPEIAPKRRDDEAIRNFVNMAFVREQFDGEKQHYYSTYYPNGQHMLFEKEGQRLTWKTYETIDDVKAAIYRLEKQGFEDMRARFEDAAVPYPSAYIHAIEIEDSAHYVPGDCYLIVEHSENMFELRTPNSSTYYKNHGVAHAAAPRGAVNCAAAQRRMHKLRMQGFGASLPTDGCIEVDQFRFFYDGHHLTFAPAHIMNHLTPVNDANTPPGQYRRAYIEQIKPGFIAFVESMRNVCGDQVIAGDLLHEDGCIYYRLDRASSLTFHAENQSTEETLSIYTFRHLQAALEEERQWITYYDGKIYQKQGERFVALDTAPDVGYGVEVTHLTPEQARIWGFVLNNDISLPLLHLLPNVLREDQAWIRYGGRIYQRGEFKTYERSAPPADASKEVRTLTPDHVRILDPEVVLPADFSMIDPGEFILESLLVEDTIFPLLAKDESGNEEVFYYTSEENRAAHVEVI